MTSWASKSELKLEADESEFIEEPVMTVLGDLFIKKYKKIKLVGSGSYSRCYLVQNIESDSTYVAKIIPKKKLEILVKEKLFYQIKIHKSLSHPNVVHLDHWYEDKDNQYIFMEYCSKGNIEQFLKKNKLEQNELKKYARQVVQAISYIHSQKVLHRDLKLCNFYLDQFDNVKLGDFGFACQLANEHDRKRETCGTPNYIAPQAFSGFGYSFSSDVWSIGVILFRMKYGICPFEGSNVKDTLEKVKTCSFTWPKSPKISPQLKDLIEKIFNLNYDDRITPSQILDHKFFAEEEDRTLEKTTQKFSFSNLFTKSKPSASVQRKNMMDRGSKNAQIHQKSKKNEKQPKKANSCETFKQIKQIFKSKSKNTIQTTQGNTTNLHTTNSQGAFQAYYTLNTVSNDGHTMREKKSHISSTNSYYNETLTNVDSMNYVNISSMNSIPRGEDKEVCRAKRLSDFIKKQSNTLSVKDELKKQKIMNLKNAYNNPPLNIGNKSKQLQRAKEQHENTSNLQKNQILFTSSKRYFLPTFIQQEKDTLIIHYKPTIKQIIFSGGSFIIYKNSHNIFNIKGEKENFDSLPKVQKYILENKIKIVETDEDESEENQMKIQKVLQCVPVSWVLVREGVVLKYGVDESLIVSKLFVQEAFQIWDTKKNGTNAFCMYCVGQNEELKYFQGIVIMRIYMGWVKNLMKK